MLSSCVHHEPVLYRNDFTDGTELVLASELPLTCPKLYYKEIWVHPHPGTSPTYAITVWMNFGGFGEIRIGSALPQNLDLENFATSSPRCGQQTRRRSSMWITPTTAVSWLYAEFIIVLRRSTFCRFVVQLVPTTVQQLAKFWLTQRAGP